MRDIDGVKVAFVSHEVYFESLMSPSMVSTHRATGADIVLMLAPGKTRDDVSDDSLRELIASAKATKVGS